MRLNNWNLKIIYFFLKSNHLNKKKKWRIRIRREESYLIDGEELKKRRSWTTVTIPWNDAGLMGLKKNGKIFISYI